MEAAPDEHQAETSGPIDLVHLDLPLDARHASTARLVGGSLAADAGMRVDEIDDLRLGIDEAVSVLADGVQVDGARLRIDYRRHRDRLDVELTSEGPPPPFGLDELAARILDTVVDHFALEGSTISLTKARSTLPGTDTTVEPTGEPSGGC